MSESKEIIYSRELPPGNRIFISFECDFTSHSLPLHTNILPDVFKRCQRSNKFFNFRYVLKKSRTKSWNCGDTGCILLTQSKLCATNMAITKKIVVIKDIVFSLESPPGNRFIISFQCPSISHFISVPIINTLHKDVCDQKPCFLLFKTMLRRSLRTKSKCDDESCFLHKTSYRRITYFTEHLWKVMTAKVKSYFAIQYYMNGEYNNLLEFCTCKNISFRDNPEGKYSSFKIPEVFGGDNFPK
ncbi:30578_t:CDS:2, partial [Racocetra persica]